MRYLLLDHLKFFSIIIMISYHYFFIDSFLFGAKMWDFNSYLLELIRFLFIGISGFALALSYSKLKTESYFRYRLFKLLFASVLISVVSWFLFPDYFIYFGIIHLIFAANLLIYLFNFFKFYLFLVPFILIIFPEILHVNFIRLSTLDYFPFFPYLFYFLVPFLSFKFTKKFLTLKKPNYISYIVKPSLIIYLLHPIVIFIYLHLYYKLI